MHNLTHLLAALPLFLTLAYPQDAQAWICLSQRAPEEQQWSQVPRYGMALQP